MNEMTKDDAIRLAAEEGLQLTAKQDEALAWAAEGMPSFEGVRSFLGYHCVEDAPKLHYAVLGVFRNEEAAALARARARAIRDSPVCKETTEEPFDIADSPTTFVSPTSTTTTTLTSPPNWRADLPAAAYSESIEIKEWFRPAWDNLTDDFKKLVKVSFEGGNARARYKSDRAQPSRSFCAMSERKG